MIELAIAFVSYSAPASAQEQPQVPGAYRGPEQERTLGADLEFQGSGLLGLARRRSGWEFWFEHERDLLLRGEPDYPARAVGADGRYGSEVWSVQRDELLLSSLPLLVEGLQSEQPALREACALALGRIGYPAAEGLLAQALADPEPAVRQAACLGLGLLGTVGAEEVLRERFADVELGEAERGIAALALGLSGRTGAGSALKLHVAGLLAGGDLAEPALAQAVAIAASVHRSRDFVPMLLELDARLAREKGADARAVRASICQTLGAIGDERAQAELARTLEDANGALARAAAQALGRVGGSPAVAAIGAKARATRDPELRALCLLALGRIGGHRVSEELERLAPAAAAEAEVHAAWLLAGGLARSPEAYERILAALRVAPEGAAEVRAEEASAAPRGDESVRAAAALGLGLFGNPQAVEFLVAALDESASGDPELQGYLATALGLVRSPAAEQALLDLADASTELDRRARRGLAVGLGLCGTERSAVALARLLVADGDSEVRWSAARALAHARSNDALRVLVEDLRRCVEARETPERAAHLALGLGFLGDVHRGATLDGLVAGMDFLQESRLLDALRSY